ncbi:dihydrolipoyl dehydrogenase [Acidihalobacter ferrooxydans]|uniref:Dihydrolipoyl dehydrogenase n=1 Tax=Acidihalobacter ferrooxydans TaxID=1765967 RepID=A0A1P8UKN9_9GAMM|nr:dihydrolipoyl dehydrogenase [Acidihalobacter ferrooxydans]APZ44342.1 dihydrolipoyl dehydrogenase [Acidihalobacter ferrooxydans]
MEKDYDLIVVGAGPAGYVAALRAAQLGLKVGCIDNWLDADGKPSLGGTCLNVGCIPSKALLDTSHHYDSLLREYADHGVLVDGLRIDVETMQTRKRSVVGTLTQGIATLFKAADIDWLKGHGQLLGSGRVGFAAHDRKTPRELSADNIILAPGSLPSALDAAALDGDYVVDSTGGLEFSEVPKRLAVIGAGAIGLELGSVWRRLGAEVTLLEAQPEFLPIADQSLARMAFKSYTAQGLQIRLGARIKSAKLSGKSVRVVYEDANGEQQERYDRVIVAVGRRPNTVGLNAEGSGLLLDERGCIHVDDHCRTNLPGVWAIGDAVRGPMLAHKGEEEGVMVAERIAGLHSSVDHNLIPAVIYTHPEFAWVGPTEQRLKQAGIPYRSGRFPLAANGRARAQGDTEGEIKLLAHAETDRLLAAHMFGANASDLIAQAVIAISLQASAEDLARTVFAHPTLSEAVHEAALAVDGRALHSAARPKRG